MAHMIEYDGMERINGVLTRLSRDSIRLVVMAGAEACVEETKKQINSRGHVGKTRSMLVNVRPGKYHEDIGSGWVEVYPQGEDPRGVSNAKKAFVINYGYGGRRTEKTGDKFITGHKATMQEVVSKAMQAESDRIVQQLTEG